MNKLSMRSKLFRIIFLSIIFSLLVSTIFGCTCTYFSPIVGKWQDNKSDDIIEFTRDGNVILESDGYFATGRYELIGDDIVKLYIEGFAGAFLLLSGEDTWQYTISGDVMTVKAGGDSSILYRYGSIGSTSPSANTQTTTTLSTNNDTPFVVQSIYVVDRTQFDGRFYISVILEPTSLAMLNTNYTVALYENGEFRASGTLQYRYNELNILIKNMKFPCSEDEYQKYYQQTDISNIFSVVISE